MVKYFILTPYLLKMVKIPLNHIEIVMQQRKVNKMEKGTAEYRTEHFEEMQKWSLDKKIEHSKKRIKE